MHTDSIEADSSIKRALTLGFDRLQAQRLAFVRWSMYEGYAQFMEEITSDAPVIETRPGFEPAGVTNSTRSASGREVLSDSDSAE